MQNQLKNRENYDNVKRKQNFHREFVYIVDRSTDLTQPTLNSNTGVIYSIGDGDKKRQKRNFRNFNFRDRTIGRATADSCF